MVTVALQDVERDLLGYLRRVEQGETLLIVRDGTPVAEVRPVAAAPAKRQPRPYGLAAGVFTVPEGFDAPLPDDVLRDFEGR